jgi:hypothetical protein
MTRYIVFAASTALALSPAVVLAASNSQGSTNGTGWNHSNGPASTGQPNQSCQAINGGDTGLFYPGHTSNAPGSAFNETSGNAGTHYAGSQPQNSRNSASVAQYDVACSHQPGL